MSQTSKERKIVASFREALKAVMRNSERGAQSKLATKIERRSSYISDIINDRRTGSESKRREIAEALEYDYDAFIEMGNKLLKGMSWQDVHEQYEHTFKIQHSLDNDPYLQRLHQKWIYLSDEQKETVLKNIDIITQNSLASHSNSLDALPYRSEERIKYIWSIAFEEYTLPSIFDMTFEKLKIKYINGELSDIHIYKAAKTNAKKLYDSIEKKREEAKN
ncbi:MAG: hypothetical protein HQK65_22510 [Desulfamplus sp.]|nr:hypothetical protein [Desulfamplus sp.]